MSIRACSLGSGISVNRNSQTNITFFSNKYRLFASPRSLRIIACVAGISKKAREENETVSECSLPPHFSLIVYSPQARFFACTLARSLVRFLACMENERKRMLRRLEDQAFLGAGGEKQKKA